MNGKTQMCKQPMDAVLGQGSLATCSIYLASTYLASMPTLEFRYTHMEVNSYSGKAHHMCKLDLMCKSSLNKCR